MRAIAIILFLFLFSMDVFSQSSDAIYYKIKTREIGVNMRPLVQNFISVGSVSRPESVRSLFFKGINAKKNGIRISFGASGTNEDNPGFFFLSVGLEKRLKGFNKFEPFTGFDFFINAPTDETVSNTDIGAGFGFGPILGINYNISDRFSCGSESGLFFTSGTEGQSAFDFVPPINFYLNVKFNKKVIAKRNIKYF